MWKTPANPDSGEYTRVDVVISTRILFMYNMYTQHAVLIPTPNQPPMPITAHLQFNRKQYIQPQSCGSKQPQNRWKPSHSVRLN